MWPFKSKEIPSKIKENYTDINRYRSHMQFYAFGVNCASAGEEKLASIIFHTLKITPLKALIDENYSHLSGEIVFGDSTEEERAFAKKVSEKVLKISGKKSLGNVISI